MVLKLTHDHELLQWTGEPWVVTYRGKDIMLDRQSRGCVSRSVREVQRGHCALQVRVIVTPRVQLKRIGMTIYISKDESFFSEVHS